jgi:hypothetical protein
MLGCACLRGQHMLLWLLLLLLLQVLQVEV